MAELDRRELGVRLDALYRDLDTFPAGVSCPWQIARVFNELMRQTKAELKDDPVIGSIGTLKAAPPEDGQPEITPVLVGAVRALVAQLLVALGDKSPAAER